MGKCDQKDTEEILDYFVGAGGNFIDTANNYQVRGFKPFSSHTVAYADEI